MSKSDKKPYKVKHHPNKDEAKKVTEVIVKFVDELEQFRDNKTLLMTILINVSSACIYNTFELEDIPEVADKVASSIKFICTEYYKTVEDEDDATTH